MDIRASFATAAAMQHCKQVRTGQATETQEKFLSTLAAHMNTSVSMLKQVYISVDDSPYLEVAKRVYAVFGDQESAINEL